MRLANARKKWLGILFCLGLGACAGQGMREDADALYHRLGGRKFLVKMSSDIVTTWKADPRLVGAGIGNHRLASADPEVLKRKVFDFLCWASAGPCAAGEASLGQAMQDMRLTATEWFYLLDGFVGNFDKHDLPLREKNELMDYVNRLQVHAK